MSENAHFQQMIKQMKEQILKCETEKKVLELDLSKLKSLEDHLK